MDMGEAQVITTYKIETGQIMSSFVIWHGDDIVTNVVEGESYILGGYSPNNFYVSGGVAVVIPDRPSDTHDWDWSSKTWIDNVADYLPELTVKALRHINQINSEYRGKFITDVKDQATVYELKRQSAVAFLADPDPQPDAYPLIFAEVGVTADSAENVAQVYLGLNAFYMQALAALEQIRLIAVNEIENATERNEIDNALVSFDTAIGDLPF